MRCLTEPWKTPRTKRAEAASDHRQEATVRDLAPETGRGAAVEARIAVAADPGIAEIDVVREVEAVTGDGDVREVGIVGGAAAVIVEDIGDAQGKEKNRKSMENEEKMLWEIREIMREK
ncbi:hypothetical protein B9Z55_015846 [Caenorhabditis nigoni]|uniref:Uncharacterized protein n=1 Tax=Caenorhabditis nigoni TaxID=1611254 RepID=A0A2G5UC36_9PELO|nr:hypothetical protein B9Z55_015846 [Caenorhabditis nigoni]